MQEVVSYLTLAELSLPMRVLLSSTAARVVLEVSFHAVGLWSFDWLSFVLEQRMLASMPAPEPVLADGLIRSRTDFLMEI